MWPHAIGLYIEIKGLRISESECCVKVFITVKAVVGEVQLFSNANRTNYFHSNTSYYCIVQVLEIA